jgi:hypothetical protein
MDSTSYAIWKSMRTRCCNKNCAAYKHYGGRGIKICQRWMDSFENFLNDMGERPSMEHTLDRIDNNGDYCVENCRWATQLEQKNNTRKNAFLSFNGKTQTIAYWARELNLSPATISGRYQRGLSDIDCLSTPESHGFVNEDIVREIFLLRSQGKTMKEIGEPLNLKASTVCNILNRKAWTKVQIADSILLKIKELFSRNSS